jgi:transcriptional regulator with XRE-family HTH domain
MDAETQVEAPFGEWLLRKLRERDMSLSDVARLAQCDYTYLWRLVNVGRARGRQYRRPSYAMAERVGRALGATHEALTAAGYLPAENVQNSRVVDALDRVERQLHWIREELTQEAAATPSGAAAPGATSPCRLLPLVKDSAWPENPDAVPDQIELPAWLAADARWAVRVAAGAASSELQSGDLALIRQGSARTGQLTAVLRRGKLAFVTKPGKGTTLGTITAFIRCLESE